MGVAGLGWTVLGPASLKRASLCSGARQLQARAPPLHQPVSSLPTSTHHAADLPYGLCAFRGIAEICKVPTPTIDK